MLWIQLRRRLHLQLGGDLLQLVAGLGMIRDDHVAEGLHVGVRRSLCRQFPELNFGHAGDRHLVDKKGAWFMAMRLRHAASRPGPFAGPVAGHD